MNQRTCHQCGREGTTEDIKARQWHEPNKHDSGVVDVCNGCFKPARKMPIGPREQIRVSSRSGQLLAWTRRINGRAYFFKVAHKGDRTELLVFRWKASSCPRHRITL